MRSFLQFLIFLTFFSCTKSPPLPPQKTIGIFTPIALGKKDVMEEPWDPDSINAGIAGSEEAAIYMSQELANLGYKVYVFANPPEGSRHSLPDANPCFLQLDDATVPKLDIAVSCRIYCIPGTFQKYAPKAYLWPHDVYDKAARDLRFDAFEDIFWLSSWQRKQWISNKPLFARCAHIFGNGINPKQFHPVKDRENPYSCIYGSNYARGLEILLNCWPEVKKLFPRATLDIYYGWQTWGLFSPKKEAEMRAKVASLAHLGVVDYGRVGHEELNRAYERASFWTYPCTGDETFCITALRAQLAGAIPIVIAETALKETVKHGYRCFDTWQYFDTLVDALGHAEQISLADRKKMGEFVLEEFTWKEIAQKWQTVFEKKL